MRMVFSEWAHRRRPDRAAVMAAPRIAQGLTVPSIRQDRPICGYASQRQHRDVPGMPKIVTSG